MTTHLMNSAMMPAEGDYQLRKITKFAFVEGVIAAHRAGSLESSIGYPQNQALIRQMTGITVPLSREVTNVQDGDEMLIMKLPYRPDAKGAQVNADDFEYLRATFVSK